ncbi:MAG: polysaccharide deacetylase family protein [Acidobacteriota bacterium]
MSVVLVYHSVTDRVQFPWLEIRPGTLAAQLEQVTALGYRWTTPRRAVASPTERLAALTFDDGLADFSAAFDVLRSRSIPVVQYVCPGLVGTTSSWASAPELRARRLLTSDELRELASGGCEFGCHGWTHESFEGLPPERLRNDLRRCQGWFREELGQAADSLAYPYGHCDARTARLAGEHFDLALAVDPVAEVPPQLAVPRLCGAEGMEGGELEGQLERYDLSRWLTTES